MVEAKRNTQDGVIRQQQWLRRLFYVLLLLIGLGLLTPFAIKYAIINGLISLGHQQVTVEDVNFNPFSGVLQVKSLQAKVLGKTELEVELLSVDMDWLPLFKQHILIKSTLLKGVRFKVEQGDTGQLNIAGIQLPATDSKKQTEQNASESGWNFGFGQIHLLDNTIQFSSSNFSKEIKINDLSLRDLLSWEASQAAILSFDTRVNGGIISGSIDMQAFTNPPVYKGALKISDLAVDDIVSLAGGTLKELKAVLSTDLNFVLAIEPLGINYQQQGSISVRDSLIGLEGIELSQQQVDWNGELKFKRLDEQINLMAKGDLLLTKHQHSLASAKLETQLESASWGGELSMQTRSGKTDLTLTGGVKLAGLNSQNNQTKLSILQLDQLSIAGIVLKQLSDIQLQAIQFDGLALAKNPAAGKPLINIAQLTLNDVKLAQLADINIEALTVNGLSADVGINQQGKVALFDELLASLPLSDGKPEKDSATKQASLLRIGKVDVIASKPIVITTKTDTDLVKKKVLIKHLSMAELDNQQANTLTPFRMAATINQHSKLALDGKIAPFSKKLNAQIRSTLTSFELPEFSPIIRKELGYDVDSGQLNSDISLNIKDDLLDGNVKLALHQLVMKPADLKQVDKMAQQLSMPLDSALSLLRDENDDIELQIPIRGDVSSPDFDMADVINTAIGGALQGTVTNSLKYALQPYGLIYMAAEKAYGIATAIKLEAVAFKENDYQLTEAAKDYMQKIGQLMQKRPSLKVRVCGVATVGERLVLMKQNKLADKEHLKDVVSEGVDVLHDDLLALAKERAQTVKSYLVDHYKVSEGRLFTCLPKVSEEKGQQARVELLI